MPAGAVSLTAWPTGLLAWWRPDLLREINPADAAEIVLLAIGGVLLLAGIAAVTAGRRWRRTLTLPDAPEHTIEPADLLVSLLAVWTLPALFQYVAGLLGGGYEAAASATTQAASAATQAASTPTPGAAGPLRLWLSIGQAAAQLAVALLVLAIGAARVRGGLPGWGLSLQGFGRRLATAILAFVALWPACAALLMLTRLFLEHVWGMDLPPAHTSLLVLQSAEIGIWTKAMIAVNAILLAPLAEELFFRGLLQTAVARWSGSPWIGVAATAVVFGAMHAQFFDTVPALVVFGGILGYAYARTGSLTLVILIHAVFNGKNVLWALLGP